ncbi:MAG: S-layer homology domain-containing protein [Firmicutes bacterium]|nr:S-layer homology domain-containing protein [Bacillota bacterium]
MRKLCAMALCFLMLASITFQSVQAGGVRITVDASGSAWVEGITETAPGWTTIGVRGPNGAFAEIGQTYADASGAYNYVWQLHPGMGSGIYRLFCNGIETGSFYWASEYELLQIIMSGDQNGITYIINNSMYLGVDSDAYNKLINKSNVAQAAVGQNFESITEAAQFLNELIASMEKMEVAEMIQEIKTSSENEIEAVLIKYNNRLQFDFGSFYQSNKAFINKGILGTDLSNGEEQTVLDSWNLWNALARVNLANNQTMGGVLEANAHFLGIDLNGYYAKVQNKSYIFDRMEKGTYNSEDALQEDFSKAVAVSAVNEAQRSSIEKTIVDLESNFPDIRISEFLKLTVTRQQAVLIAMLEKNFLDEEGISHAFNTAIDNALGNGAGSSGASPGKGGAVSNGLGNLSSAPTAMPSAVIVDGNSNAAEGFFSDVTLSHWAWEAVESFAGKGIISGVGDGLFAPDTLVKREEFAKMLAGAFGMSLSNAETSFTDLEPNAWYVPYISACFEAGLILGVSEEYFGISEYLTRQDMIVLVDRALVYKNTIPKIVAETESFVDTADIAPYALESVTRLHSAGIVSGVGGGRVAPLDMVTRAMAVKILHGAIQD